MIFLSLSLSKLTWHELKSGISLGRSLYISRYLGLRAIKSLFMFLELTRSRTCFALPYLNLSLLDHQENYPILHHHLHLVLQANQEV
jgi:hypothetical protein